MKQLGTVAFTAKTLQRVVNKYGTRKRGSEKVGAYPLDVGYMTPNEIVEAACGAVGLRTVYSRLSRGERKLSQLIAAPLLPSARSPARIAADEIKARRRRAAAQIRSDKAAHFAQRRSEHGDPK